MFGNGFGLCFLKGFWTMFLKRGPYLSEIYVEIFADEIV